MNSVLTKWGVMAIILVLVVSLFATAVPVSARLVRKSADKDFSSFVINKDSESKKDSRVIQKQDIERKQEDAEAEDLTDSEKSIKITKKESADSKVEPLDPVEASLTVSHSPQNPIVGDYVIITATAYDPDGIHRISFWVNPDPEKNMDGEFYAKAQYPIYKECHGAIACKVTYVGQFPIGTHTYWANSSTEPTRETILRDPETVGTTKSFTVSARPSVYTCTDSDNGLDYDTRGTTVQYEDGIAILNESDYCTLAPGGNDPLLVEFRCNNGKVEQVGLHDCAYGCANGKCAESDQNLPPVAFITEQPPGTIEPGQEVSFNSQALDMESGASGLSYTWISSNPGIISTEPSFSTSEFVTPGEHKITLRVEDPQGNVVEDFTSVGVLGSDCTQLTDYETNYITEDTVLCEDKDTYLDAHVVISASDVELDCNGAVLDGIDGTGFGIDLKGNDITVKNCNIKNYDIGIADYLPAHRDNTIQNNVVSDTTSHAFWFAGLRGYTITQNTGFENIGGRGLKLYGGSTICSDISVTNNKFSNAFIYKCTRVTMEENEFTSSVWFDGEMRNKYNTINNNILNGFVASGPFEHNTITNNVISGNGGKGIRLYKWSSNNLIAGNTIYGFSTGILIDSEQGESEDNTVRDNIIYENSDYGIYVKSGTSGNLIYNNKLEHNGVNARDDGNGNDWNVDKTPGTSIAGGPYLGGNYYFDYTGSDVDVPPDGIGDVSYTIMGSAGSVDELPLVLSGTGCVYLTNYATNYIAGNTVLCEDTYLDAHVVISASDVELDCNGAVLDGIDGTGFGIDLNDQDNVNIKNCEVRNFEDGIYAYLSNALTVQDNEVTSNTGVGIFIDGFVDSSNPTTLTDVVVSNNVVNDNAENGIQITGVYDSEVYDNTANSNYRGIFLTYSDNNNVHDNTVESNSLYGIAVHNSDENTIHSNTATNNAWNIYTGLVLTPNLIYNNYFADAKTKNYFLGSTTTNTWNTDRTEGENIIGGPYLGGNYWDDYTGADSNGDGIGEASYSLSGPVGQGVDELPLTNLLTSPPVANAGLDQSVNFGEVVTLDGSASYDPDGTIVLYEWDFEGDGTYDWSSDVTGITTYTYGNTGAFLAVLRVTDNGGATDTDSALISVVDTTEPNNAPAVTVTSPNGGEALKDSWDITWDASDPDGDDLVIIVIEYSSNSGSSWNTIAEEEYNDGTYEWDVSGLADGNNYLVRVTAFDGELSASDQSNSAFKIDKNGDGNPPPEEEYTGGGGGGSISYYGELPAPEGEEEVPEETGEEIEEEIEEVETPETEEETPMEEGTETTEEVTPTIGGFITGLLTIIGQDMAGTVLGLILVAIVVGALWSFFSAEHKEKFKDTVKRVTKVSSGGE